MTAGERLRERVREAKRPSRRKEWHQPTLAEFRPSWRVLAFDQSLVSTGWVLIEVASEQLVLHDKGTIHTRIRQADGHLGSIERAEDLAATMAIFGGLWASVSSVGYDDVIAEATPIVGYRLESSLLAAYVIRHNYGERVTFVSRQKAVSRLIPPEARTGSKRDTQHLLDTYLPDGPKRWNEHERDALMLGLCHLLRRTA
jgi:hypothetical protein